MGQICYKIKQLNIKRKPIENQPDEPSKIKVMSDLNQYTPTEIEFNQQLDNL